MKDATAHKTILALAALGFLSISVSAGTFTLFATDTTGTTTACSNGTAYCSVGASGQGNFTVKNRTITSAYFNLTSTSPYPQHCNVTTLTGLWNQTLYFNGTAATVQTKDMSPFLEYERFHDEGSCKDEEDDWSCFYDTSTPVYSFPPATNNSIQLLVNISCNTGGAQITPLIATGLSNLSMLQKPYCCFGDRGDQLDNNLTQQNATILYDRIEVKWSMNVSNITTTDYPISGDEGTQPMFGYNNDVYMLTRMPDMESASRLKDGWGAGCNLSGTVAATTNSSTMNDSHILVPFKELDSDNVILVYNYSELGDVEQFCNYASNITYDGNASTRLNLNWDNYSKNLWVTEGADTLVEVNVSGHTVQSQSITGVCSDFDAKSKTVLMAVYANSINRRFYIVGRNGSSQLAVMDYNSTQWFCKYVQVAAVANQYLEDPLRPIALNGTDFYLIYNGSGSASASHNWTNSHIPDVYGDYQFNLSIQNISGHLNKFYVSTGSTYSNWTTFWITNYTQGCVGVPSNSFCPLNTSDSSNVMEFSFQNRRLRGYVNGTDFLNSSTGLNRTQNVSYGESIDKYMILQGLGTETDDTMTVDYICTGDDESGWCFDGEWPLYSGGEVSYSTLTSQGPDCPWAIDTSNAALSTVAPPGDPEEGNIYSLYGSPAIADSHYPLNHSYSTVLWNVSGVWTILMNGTFWGNHTNGSSLSGTGFVDNITYNDQNATANFTAIWFNSTTNPVSALNISTKCNGPNNNNTAWDNTTAGTDTIKACVDDLDSDGYNDLLMLKYLLHSSISFGISGTVGTPTSPPPDGGGPTPPPFLPQPPPQQTVIVVDIDNTLVIVIEDVWEEEGTDTDPDIDPDDDDDGIGDFWDNDDDDDGWPDDYDFDDDNDQVPDFMDQDDDGDGRPDYMDPDDDADGIQDGIEESIEGIIIKIIRSLRYTFNLRAQLCSTDADCGEDGVCISGVCTAKQTKAVIPPEELATFFIIVALTTLFTAVYLRKQWRKEWRKG